EPLSPEQGRRLLADICGTPEKLAGMITHCADEAALERGFVSELLPLLTMLVGGYLAARAEVLAVSDGDLATEFLLLLEMENPAG
ncbi:MAG TPA: hypothetical protein VFF94_17190, partial [Novosphingobium sp.]|nr:hypothetical protein [Novosphingobium sp.]